MTDSLTIWGTDYTGVKGFKAGAQSDGPTGKNLYNPATKTDGYFLNSSGVLTEESTCSISDYIAVVPGENYVWSGVSGKTGSNNKRVVGYTTAKAYSQVIKAVSVTGIGIPYENSFTVPTGVYFVRLSYNTADSELMIEHGSTKTSYEPYTNIVNYAYLRPQGTKSITQNGTGIDVAEYATVDVNVSGGGSPTLQTKTKSYTPTESQQTEAVIADSGYDGLDTVNVTVGAISSSYVGSGITRRSSSDLTVSGATVSAPTGYYESSASKAVASGSASTPATTITANPTISVSSGGLITATASASQNVTPTVSAGYVSSGTAGTVSVSGSNTSQLTTQAAQTIHPSTSDQTIASGKYLTGAQTIKAVTLANLTADNIKNGVTVTVGDSTDADCVASVTGTYTGSGSTKNIQVYSGYASRTANSYGATSVTLTVAKTGTYKITWMAWRSSSSGTMGTNLHKGSTAESTNHTTWTGTYGQCITLNNQNLTKDQVLTLYATSGSNSRTIYVGNLIIEEQQ